MHADTQPDGRCRTCATIVVAQLGLHCWHEELQNQWLRDMSTEKNKATIASVALAGNWILDGDTLDGRVYH
jgi:hypothetical protein